MPLHSLLTHFSERLKFFTNHRWLAAVVAVSAASAEQGGGEDAGGLKVMFNGTRTYTKRTIIQGESRSTHTTTRTTHLHTPTPSYRLAGEFTGTTIDVGSTTHRMDGLPLQLHEVYYDPTTQAAYVATSLSLEASLPVERCDDRGRQRARTYPRVRIGILSLSASTPLQESAYIMIPFYFSANAVLRYVSVLTQGKMLRLTFDKNNQINASIDRYGTSNAASGRRTLPLPFLHRVMIKFSSLTPAMLCTFSLCSF